MTNSNNMRKNGLASPYNAMQIGTWFLLPTIVLQFLIFISPTIPSTTASVFVTLLFLVSACSSIYFAYMTSASDPIDPRLYSLLKDKNKQQRQQQHNGNGNDNDNDNDNNNTCIQCITLTPPSVSSRFKSLNRRTLTTNEEEEATKFCWVCQARVGCASMHCKFCNKCVSNFDHHCQWLNTCIGDANYAYFTKCVASLCVMSYLQVFCSIAVLVSHFNNNTNSSDDHDHSWWFTNSNSAAAPAALLTWILFTILFLILNTGVALLITQLLFFHFQLHNKQITTYEYILQDNAKRRDKERYMIALDNKRKLELRNDNYDAFYKLRLHLGSFAICKCIDPLQQQSHQQSQSKKDHRKSASNNTTTTPSIEESKSTESQKLTNNMHANNNGNNYHANNNSNNSNGGTFLSNNNNAHTNVKSSQQIESLDIIVPNNSNPNRITTTTVTDSIEISVQNSNASTTSSHHSTNVSSSLDNKV